MTDLSTGNGHDGMGGLAPPVTRPRDPTGASRSRRYREKRKATVTAAAPPPTIQPDQRPTEKPNDFKEIVTVERDAALPANRRDGEKLSTKAVTPFPEPQWQAIADPAPASRGERRWSVTSVAAAVCLAAVGLTLSTVGAVETATYSLAVGGVLFWAPGHALSLVAATAVTAKGRRPCRYTCF
jgi:hypothetical protein